MRRTIYKIRDINRIPHSWYYILIYFLLSRLVIGFSNAFPYVLFLAIILLRIPLQLGALMFLLAAVVVYIFGAAIEANHYMSFVYGLLFLFLLKSIYLSLEKYKIK